MALALQTPRIVVLSHQTLAQATVDKLGKVQAQMAPLKNEEAALKQLLRDSGETVVEGELYRATITAGKPGKKIDWEALARHYLADDVIDRALPTFTTATEPGEPRVTVKARIGL